VRLTMGRARCSRHRTLPGCFIKARMGSTRDGRMTAAQAYLLFESEPMRATAGGHSR